MGRKNWVPLLVTASIQCRSLSLSLLMHTRTVPHCQEDSAGPEHEQEQPLHPLLPRTPGGRGLPLER